MKKNYSVMEKQAKDSPATPLGSEKEERQMNMTCAQISKEKDLLASVKEGEGQGQTNSASGEEKTEVLNACQNDTPVNREISEDLGQSVSGSDEMKAGDVSRDMLSPQKSLSASSSESEETLDNNILHLDLLPFEIILHIFSFLDAKFTICTVGKVCRTFHRLISDVNFWKTRIRKRWPNKYPAIPGETYTIIYMWLYIDLNMYFCTAVNSKNMSNLCFYVLVVYVL